MRASLITLCLCLLGHTSRAALLVTTNFQTAGSNWNQLIWKTNLTDIATVAPTSGNTYACVFNGIAFGSGSTSNTVIRNPTNNPTATFIGDTLMLNTNTELRLVVTPTNTPLINFPGTNGNPGLILNGGVINAGSNAVFSITGAVQVLSRSYISPADGGGGGLVTSRAVGISAKLSGGGTLVFTRGATNNAARITSTNNTFTGQWLVAGGYLFGVATNSLGTNSITLDPLYDFSAEISPNTPTNISPTPPSLLEFGYDINSAGVLSLTNGGLMRLHQNCAFSGLNIENDSLAPGPYSYLYLRATYPNNFLAGGSGAITVQPYGVLPPPIPTILVQPVPERVYNGTTARFFVTANAQGTVTNQWQKDGTDLNDGANILGSGTTNLIVSGVSAGDVAGYSAIVANQTGAATSSVVQLTLVTTSGEAYEGTVVAAGPVAFYQLNETGDPATNNSPAFDYVGGYSGIYGTNVNNGNSRFSIAGPRPGTGFPGFTSTNFAARTFYGIPGDFINVSPWNLSTNAVTLTAWVNAIGAQTNGAGLIFCRDVSTVAGLNFTANKNPVGNYTLGYTWNNEGLTTKWNSGLDLPPGQWSFVALVVTPTNAVIYLMNPNGVVSSPPHVYPHVVQTFRGTTLIGADSGDGGNGTRSYKGTIDDVAVFNSALSASQLLALYSAASGSNSFAPAIGVQPAGQTNYVGQTVQFSVGAGGTQPLAYQWQAGATNGGVYTNLTDTGSISGSKTAALIITGIGLANAADYIVVITNSVNSITSSVARLAVLPTGPATNITLAVQQGQGLDWESTGGCTNWSDCLAASVSAAAKPGSTYEVLPGARLRTPVDPLATNFPGNVLTVDGNGVWNVNPGAGAAIGEIRFKQPTNGFVNGAVTFKKLVMNGGQLDAGNDGVIVIGGEMDILKNTPWNNDSGNDRGYQVGAWLTGAGSIEYHGYNQAAFNTNYVNPLNLTGTSNTFSGPWSVVTGVLLASGTNSLGTNNVTVGANGALETAYDIHSGNANLYITGSGRMYLHQADTFHGALVGTNVLAPGTYSFATLNASYPTNFPASWTQQTGSAFSTASGSLTVLGTLTFSPPTLSAQVQGTNLVVSGRSGVPNASYYMLASTNVALPLNAWTRLATNNFDGFGNASFTVAVGTGSSQQFFRLQQAQ